MKAVHRLFDPHTNFRGVQEEAPSAQASQSVDVASSKRMIYN